MFSAPVRALSEIISNVNKDNFDDVITHPFFVMLLATKNNILLNYISLNVKKIFEFAIYTKPTRPAVSLRCFELITSTKGNMNAEIIKNQVLFELIRKELDILNDQTEKTLYAFFAILEALSSQTSSIFEIFANNESLMKIIPFIGYGECLSFLSNLATSSKMKNTLMKAKLPEIIIKEILKNKDTLADAYQLFISCFKTLPHSELYAALTNNNAFAEIIQNSIDSPKDSSFLFLNQLVNFSLNYGKWSSWRSVFGMIKSRLPDIISIFMKSEKFTSVSESIVILTVSVFNETRTATSEINDMFFKLYTDFFKYPNNGILHNTFVSFMRAFKKNDCLTYDLISSVHMYENILQTSEEKGKTRAVYWAQLKKIAEMIDHMFKPTDSVSKEKWRALMLKFRDEELIIKRPYGGQLPKNSLVINIIVIVLVLIFVIAAILYLLFKLLK